MAKEKLQGTETQCRFGDSEIKLSFRKRIEPVRNGKEPIFVTVNLPECISDQAVRLAFSHFGEVVSVFKGRHKFNRKIRNGKRHIRIFAVGGNSTILPGKIAFHGGVSCDVLFAEKVVLCYRCKTLHMLGENCPVVSPTPEGSDMSYTEQSETPEDSKTPEKTDPSVENQPSAESRQEMSSTEKGSDGENSSTDETGDDSDSGSTSESNNEDGSALVSSVPETPLQKTVTSTSQTKPLNENQLLNQKTDTSSRKHTIVKSQETGLKNRPFKTLRDFWHTELSYYQDDTDFLEILADAEIKGNQKYLVKMLTWAAELIHYSTEKETFPKTLDIYTRRYTLDWDLKPGPTPVGFDDHLYGLALKVWPYIAPIFDLTPISDNYKGTRKY